MFKNLFALTTALFLVVGFVGCGGDDDEDATLVSVSGVVLDVDTLELVPNVCVFLLDHEDDYISEATNEQGEFTVQVPQGSPFLLVADDCEAPMADDTGRWYPTLNADIIHTPTIDENQTGHPIHISSNISTYDAEGANQGANAAYMNYFENAENDADFFSPVTSLHGDTNNGWIFLSTFWVDTESETFFEDGTGQTGTIASPNADACPVGYFDFPDVTADGEAIDATLGPDILQAGGGTGTDETYAFITFCSDELTGTSVDLTLDSPNHTPTSVTYEDLPVRPHMCTLLFPSSIDGESVPIKDVLTLFEVL